MNGGNRSRGQGDGFILDILRKLKDVKSSDSSQSLLSYIVAYYLQHFDEDAGKETCVYPLPEPQDLFLASQMKLEDFQRDLREQQKALNAWSAETEKACNVSSDEHLQPFKDKMEEFLNIAKAELELQEKQLADTGRIFEGKDLWKRENKCQQQEQCGIKCLYCCFACLIVFTSSLSFSQAQEKATYNVKPKHTPWIKAKLGQKM